MHVPPTSIFFVELQPAASHTETTIKPRTRDADISTLQLRLLDGRGEAITERLPGVVAVLSRSCPAETERSGPSRSSAA
jgi:hypothetical protein